MLIYGNTHIPLERAVTDWLPHLTLQSAKRKAAAQALPWPVIKADDTQKSGQFVSINAIADWLDRRETEAKAEWQKVNQ